MTLTFDSNEIYIIYNGLKALADELAYQNRPARPKIGWEPLMELIRLLAPHAANGQCRAYPDWPYAGDNDVPL